MRSSQSVCGVVCLGFLVAACGTDPVSDGATVGGDSTGNGSSGGSSTAGSDGTSAGSEGGSEQSDDGVTVPRPGGTGNVSDLILTTGKDDPTQNCRTVADCADKECGPVADGCGALIECGGCEGEETCGGGGPSLCGVAGADAECTPKSCEDLDKECGAWPDECGGSVDCDVCTDVEETCNAGICEAPPACDTLRSCDFYDGQDNLCGPVSDGCGGLMDCDFRCIGDSQICGIQQEGVCGESVCVPSTDCTVALADKPTGYCGVLSDGCGGEMLDCAAVCTDGDTCGGGVGPDGGIPLEVCGQGGGGVCEPITQEAACGEKTCGFASVGCGTTVSCGTCGTDEFCDNGSCQSNVCVPKTCESLNAECGDIATGCGGDVVTCPDTCALPETCGGGSANSNTCGAPPVCVPLDTATACTDQNVECGPAQDGCNGLTDDCGTCETGEICGLNSAGVCAAPAACVPNTCQEMNSTCGATPDGCGSELILGGCGTCLDGFECTSNGAGGGQCEEIVIPCTGLCEQQDDTCDPNQQTRVTGTVYAPNGIEPLFNALVYVPNLTDITQLPAIGTGPDCVSCEDEDLGNPLVADVTGADGTFSLENVPAGVDFPLVVKMGKWRRVVMIPAVASCSDTPLAVDDMRLPRHMDDAPAGMENYVNIPKMAMATGEVDAIECVLRKIGLDDREFSAPTGEGRVHLYRGRRGAGTGCSAPVDANGLCQDTLEFAPVDDLFQNQRLNDYDVALFDCEGRAVDHSAHELALHDWADSGGRVFASHYSYKYLDSNGDFETTATWSGANEFTEHNANNPTTGIVDVSHEKGAAFNEWLGLVDAYDPEHGEGHIRITDPRGYVRTVDPNLTDHFVSIDANQDFNVDTAVQQYSFNTPVGTPAANACGKVLYSAFHVADTREQQRYRVFPDNCIDGPLSAQEKVLEFMIFDLSACVSNTAPPTCQPSTCEDLGATCGALSDGCGGALECGTCDTAGEFCGGGGDNKCGNGCTLTSCDAQGAECGTLPDGCGGQLPSCGDCTGDATCGGGGQANICGTPACTPRTCAEVSAQCGTLADGCGGSLDCGTCSGQGESCSGNQCGTGSCTPTTCEAAIDAAVGQQRCGSIGDGCDGQLECGTCPTGSVCGVGGPSLCGPTCTPLTCGDLNASCGTLADGCGGAINCGNCGEGTQCGSENQCVVFECTPATCANRPAPLAAAECGEISDGCGGTLLCGVCSAGEQCGAEVANQCGAGSCSPSTCGAGDCGITSDGCSGVVDCGPCDCTPLTCEDQGADCGPVPDGCGGLIAGGCGTCTGGNSCGGGGTPSVCGGAVQ